MPRLHAALAVGAPTVTGSNLGWVFVALVVALLALGIAVLLVREVLAASQGTAEDAGDRAGGPGGRGRLPAAPVPDPRRLRRR